ncbi:thioredoxin reductase [Thermosporothrix hazakensis]|jgi:thioredoxin reductase|uniref:Thioredoxin reductase n=2 Tax=Thermosporothrix TaxID=768650 RepID=A0A326U9U9_THEHA|nr:NAD(P)/FAD-dependent oxidoreductase [Thermosporothrix hazakensis]PZW24031.1 thioredoxin reductase [Thermosporothrix hazakensis]BBH87819.1 hypothetical protein KTC_25700 [Thermosporothrix sp. COM3]GCE50247.1 hypothetical protein KTH_51160 [Thermosporothrix hazakensis]
MIDCAIIGGGPAGLSAALVLGRARRSVVVFDDNRPRNAVTHESHGFLTRDGIKPSEFRATAHREISAYPSVEMRWAHVTAVRKQGDIFEVLTDDQEPLQARIVLLATGLKEQLPAVDGIYDYYGTSLFNCPYCDGWELRDQPLVLIAEGERTFHLAETIWNWSRDLVVCTNGHTVLKDEQKQLLHKHGIQVVEDRISALIGSNGHLERVVFASGEERNCVGGFVLTELSQAAPFASQLGCDMNAMGGIVTNPQGRTSVPGVYAAGDATLQGPAQLILAAAQGSQAAMHINATLTERAFH